MDAQRTPGQLQFHPLGRRQVVGQFDGGLRETDLRLGLLKRLAQCVLDYRNPNGVEHCIEARRLSAGGFRHVEPAGIG